MKVLVTGAKGMLGTDVCSELVRRGINHIATDIADLDLTDFYAIVEYIERSKPTHLINCAAYTAVDAAETNEVLAYRGNALTCLALAIACNSVNVPLLSVSTDFVLMVLKQRLMTNSTLLTQLGFTVNRNLRVKNLFAEMRQSIG